MYKTLHRKLTIEQHELHKQRGVILGARILLHTIPVFIWYWQLNFEKPTDLSQATYKLYQIMF
jgi:hypothetical protein